MSPHVCEPVGAGSEAHVTILALVVPLARMYPPVDVQRVLARELFTAEFTFVAFLEMDNIYGQISNVFYYKITYLFTQNTSFPPFFFLLHAPSDVPTILHLFKWFFFFTFPILISLFHAETQSCHHHLASPFPSLLKLWSPVNSITSTVPVFLSLSCIIEIIVIRLSCFPFPCLTLLTPLYPYCFFIIFL